LVWPAEGGVASHWAGALVDEGLDHGVVGGGGGAVLAGGGWQNGLRVGAGRPRRRGLCPYRRDPVVDRPRQPRAYGAGLVACGLGAQAYRRRRLNGEFRLAGSLRLPGSVAALDTRTGRILWRTYTIPADLGGRGGSVWGTAAIDRRRGLAYIGTGQAYSRPAGPLTDALLALRLKDGSLAWHRQFTRDDVFNYFGEVAGKDYDLGASPNLFRIGRRAVVGVGDKGGRYATLDRRTGATVWRRRLRRQPPRRHHDDGRGRPRVDLGRL
jgi:outer membrane protein assembly factor BamB